MSVEHYLELLDWTGQQFASGGRALAAASALAVARLLGAAMSPS
jgi:hypothetical protein